jgi:ubiquinol-cytochrome c reductase cytochrome b subunit
VKKTSRLNDLIERLEELYRWIDDRLKATASASIRVMLPPTFSYVLSNLGMATVVCFFIACVTGLPLLMYYRPSPWNVAYDSIKFISEEVAFGHILRGVHYHSSNAMVLLSIIHAIYVFFKRLYKGRFDFLWITGVILGVVTVIVAFTGYTLIFNDRAVEAQNIMLGITDVIHPILKAMMAGSGLSDRVLRLYAFHIGIIPAIMLALMAVHLPRALRISIPMIIGIFAVIFIATGIFPAELGPKFDPRVTPQFMPPEWYFLWVYALLRTWAPVLLSAVIVPGALILIMIAIPWLDTGRRPRLTDRPVFAVIGITSVAYWLYLTFRSLIGVGPPALQIPIMEVVGVFIATLGGSALVFRLITPYLMKRAGVRRTAPQRYISGNLSTALLVAIVAVQAVLLWAFASSYIHGNIELASIDLGLLLLGLGIAQHVYAVASQPA